MSESWKIKNWDYVLDRENAKIPQFTFSATPNFITSADLNNDNLLITLHDTSCDAYNKKNVKGVVDKSTQIIDENTGEVVAASQGQPCQNDFSARTVLYTMTLPGVCFFEGVKDGKFSLMSEYKKPKSEEEQEEEEQEEEEQEEEEKKDAGEDPDKSLPILPLALIGGVLATGALLTIFLIRRK
tara:strand:+ start:462 stop:1013 length:552 start_codon:yes stop_codon:yes gene_type:complete